MTLQGAPGQPLIVEPLRVPDVQPEPIEIPDFIPEKTPEREEVPA